MTKNPNRRSIAGTASASFPSAATRFAGAEASIDSAIDASAERAAIERDPTIATDTAISTSVVPATDLPAPDATVLPEPTLAAEPGLPQPIVTASPPLAAEPNAVDVQQAAAADDRVAAGLEPAVDPDGPHPAVAGQTMLVLDRDHPAVIPEKEARREEDARLAAAIAALDQEVRLAPAPTIDAIIVGLEHLSRTDPIGMEIIRTSFFGDGPRDASERRTDPFAKPRTVTVIEVVGPASSRRRAGRLFGPQAQRFLASDLTKEEIASLRSDPLLAVGISEVEADAFGYPIHEL